VAKNVKLPYSLTFCSGRIGKRERKKAERAAQLALRECWDDEQREKGERIAHRARGKKQGALGKEQGAKESIGHRAKGKRRTHCGKNIKP
jgi:hypothetical protein